MHDVSSIITALGSFIGGLVIAYKAWGNNKTDTTLMIIKEIKEDSDFYRKRWLKAEEGNKAKDREIARLQKLNNKLVKDSGEHTYEKFKH